MQKKCIVITEICINKKYTMSEITIETIIKEIGVTNTVLNAYNKTFEMGWTSKWYIGDTNVWDLRNYKVVTKRLQESIISKKEALLLFKQDYYKQKTAGDISLNIGVPLNTICEHLNHKRDYYNIICEDKTITSQSLIFNCSSFTILKNIQKEYLAERLELQINNPQ